MLYLYKLLTLSCDVVFTKSYFVKLFYGYLGTLNERFSLHYLQIVSCYDITIFIFQGKTIKQFTSYPLCCKHHPYHQNHSWLLLMV